MLSHAALHDVFRTTEVYRCGPEAIKMKAANHVLTSFELQFLHPCGLRQQQKC